MQIICLLRRTNILWFLLAKIWPKTSFQFYLGKKNSLLHLSVMVRQVTRPLHWIIHAILQCQPNSYTKSISTLTLSLNLYFSANCQSRLSVITVPLVPRNTIFLHLNQPPTASNVFSFCLKWCTSSLINYESYLSILFPDTSASVCAWDWLQSSLRAFFMCKDPPLRLEKEKKTQGKGKRKEGTKTECVYFSHYRSQGWY